jgi:hypothetical protein
MDHSVCFEDLSKDIVLSCLKVFKQEFFLGGRGGDIDFILCMLILHNKLLKLCKL